MIVDVEESCARLRLEIAAIVRNVAGPNCAQSGARVIEADDVDREIKGCRYMAPFFTPGNRFAAHADAAARGFSRPATIIDPTAVVAGSATIGAGTFISCGVVLGGVARIGAFVFINRGANIGHHVDISDFASVGPGAIICGSARLGRGAVAGAGAIILEEIEVGRNSVVAAGAVVTKTVAEHCLVAGNPARVIDAAYPGYRKLTV
jgi:serine acetyltransferase